MRENILYLQCLAGHCGGPLLAPGRPRCRGGKHATRAQHRHVYDSSAAFRFESCACRNCWRSLKSGAREAISMRLRRL